MCVFKQYLFLVWNLLINNRLLFEYYFKKVVKQILILYLVIYNL